MNTPTQKHKTESTAASRPAAEAGGRPETVIQQVTYAGLALNLLLSAAKFSVGLWTRSQACVADAVHSLSDSVTDVALLIGVEYWMAPADELHPHGHRRIEALVTVFIGVSLGFVAVLLALKAIAGINAPDGPPPGWAAFAVACLSIVVKEGLYRWTASAGARVHSSAMVANAWHHRSDALSSVPVALSVVVSRIWPELHFVDHVAAAIVSAMLLKAAWDIAWPSLQELADTGANEAVRGEILRIASGHAGVRSVHALRTRRLGPGFAIDLHVMVDPELSVKEGHAICKRVRMDLLKYGPGVFDVLVHLEAYEGEDAAH